ncbi:MAG: Crp/Fnr family transcriptional regulator [Verrucomicrobiales bacterium]
MAIYDLKNILNYFRSDEVIERKLDREEVLFHQGSPTQAIHFVVDGEIRLETYLKDGRSIVFYRVQSGGALSEENLFVPTHLNTGVATVETVIRSISKVGLLDLMRSDPKFSQSLVSCLAERYAHALMLRELVGIKTAEDRLLAWLHWQYFQDKSQGPLDFKGRIGNLAPELGLSRESIYRAFARLKERGEIQVTDGRVELLHCIMGS